MKPGRFLTATALAVLTTLSLAGAAHPGSPLGMRGHGLVPRQPAGSTPPGTGASGS
jgi:hypothetical protein